jgi:glycosyltransferase involved in cell wall biosynthesis
VRALLTALETGGWDYRFFTSVGFAREEWWMRAFPAGLRTELSRRAYEVPRERISRRVGTEFGRLVAQRLGRAKQGSVDRTYTDLDESVARRLKAAKNPPAVVYSYEDGSRRTFEAAAECGVRRFYDLPIAHYATTRHLLEREAERWPRWARTLGAPNDSPEKIERKARELELADCIVCPSNFVLESLPERIHSKKQIVVSPFGSPIVPVRERSESGKLRVLFAGSLTQRKGLADLFAAVRLLRSPNIELVVMGACAAPLDFYFREYREFTYEPPRAHSSFLETMLSCDVLALPSIVEGRALVQQEALACGLPIIITRNAGGEDLVIEAETGFLVPAGSPESIAEKIEWFSTHRSELRDLRASCRAKAAEYTWASYATRILDAVKVSRLGRAAIPV